MYSTTAVSRPEINEFLEEAQGAETHFIAQKVFPVLPVDARASRYPRIRIAKGGLMKRDITKRNSTGSYNEITREHDWDVYDCEDRGLKERIDDSKKREMKNFFDMEVLKAKLVRRNMLIDFEANTVKALYDVAVFAHQDAKVAYTEALIATADFAYDINAAIADLILRGVDVNTVVFSNQLWQYIRRTKLLQDYIYGNQDSTKRKLIKLSDIQTAFQEENQREITVLVGAAGYDTANRGKDKPTLEPIWPNSHIFVGNTCGGDFSAGGVGRTLSWKEDVSGGELFATETYRDEDRRSDMVRVRSNSIEKVVDDTAGQLIVTNWE